MAYKALTYPKTLTKTYWDRQKSLAAKAAGETGVGQAATGAEQAFEKIDWEVFDVVKRSPLGSSDEALHRAQQLKPSVVAEHNKSVKPTIAALRELRTKAEAAAEKLKGGKLTKNDAKLATGIATEADHFSVVLQLNSVFFDQAAKECEISVKQIEDNRHTVEESLKQTKEYLAALLQGLSKFQHEDPPTMKVWDDLVKQQGRSVSNNLKGNLELAKKYLKTWTTKFQGFDWDTLGFSNIAPDQLKAEITKFSHEVVKEAAALRQDLN